MSRMCLFPPRNHPKQDASGSFRKLAGNTAAPPPARSATAPDGLGAVRPLSSGASAAVAMMHSLSAGHGVSAARAPYAQPLSAATNAITTSSSVFATTTSLTASLAGGCSGG